MAVSVDTKKTGLIASEVALASDIVRTPVLNTDAGPPSFNLLAPSNPRAITKGTTGTWNAVGIGYGSDVVWCPVRRSYAMLTTGRKADGSLGIGLYTSVDGVTWTEYGSNPVLAASGASDWEHGSVGTPSLYWSEDEQLWHLFYEGFPTVGFEAGSPGFGHATAADLAGPWTRDSANPILTVNSYSWVGGSGQMYHPNVVEKDGRFHLFFNGGIPEYEDVGHASASSLYGPWTATADPVLPRADLGETDHATASDPYVWKCGAQYFMYVWNSITSKIHLFYCSEDEFPTTWTRDGFVTNVGNTVSIRPNPALINGEFIVFAQLTTLDTICMFRTGSVNGIGLVEAIKSTRKQFACGNDWGTVDMTGTGGARRFFKALNSGGTMASIGTASGVIGSEVEKTHFIFPTADAGYTVAGLPSAATYPRARAFVTDATATTFGSIVVGGGSNPVPVYSDATQWRIG